MNEPSKTNGELPEKYETYANTFVRQQMAVAAERDQFAADNAKLRSDAVLHKVEMEAVTSLHKAAMEAVTSENTELRSQMQTTMLMRDKAIGERAKWEALFIGIQAQMRAFEVPAAPLVTQPAE